LVHMPQRLRRSMPQWGQPASSARPHWGQSCGAARRSGKPSLYRHSPAGQRTKASMPSIQFSTAGASRDPYAQNL